MVELCSRHSLDTRTQPYWGRFVCPDASASFSITIIFFISLTRSVLTQSPTHSLTSTPTHPLPPSLPHPPTYSLTYPPTHSLTSSFARSLTQTFGPMISNLLHCRKNDIWGKNEGKKNKQRNKNTTGKANNSQMSLVISS